MESGDSISGIQRGGPPLLTYLRSIWFALGKSVPASRDRPRAAARMSVARPLLVLALMSSAQIVCGVEVHSVRVSSTPAATRLVFDVSAPVQYAVTTLDNPLRIVIDMRDTELGKHTALNKLRIAGTPVSAVRSTRQADGSLRWVLELRVSTTSRSFALPPVVPYGHRLVLDLLPGAARSPPTLAATTRAPSVPVMASRPVAQPLAQPGARPLAQAAPQPSPQPAATQDRTVATTASRFGVAAPTAVPPPTSVSSTGSVPVQSPARADPLPTAESRKESASQSPKEVSAASSPARLTGPLPPGGPIVFAIDAGHGGQDPGALGPDGVREKDVVLATAKRLAEFINAEPGFKAVLTRTGDYFIPLRERPRLARAAGAHFFVSVHADAHSNADARGASVYALSERGATSETAKWLAERENNSDLVGGVSLDNKDRVLAEVLLDLSMTASLTESLELGSLVLSELKELTHLHSRRVEQAGFMVLKSPDIPSILIETGYVSNVIEASRLASAEYRERLARAIFRGLTAQALRRPPQGTSVALRGRGQPANEVLASASDAESVSAPRAQHGENSNAALPVTDSNRAYVVVAGDTLHTIAERFGVPPRLIRRLNAMRTDRVRVGQTLRIPPASGAS